MEECVMHYWTIINAKTPLDAVSDLEKSQWTEGRESGKMHGQLVLTFCNGFRKLRYLFNGIKTENVKQRWRLFKFNEQIVPR